jgi:hypothetical protein
MKTPTILEILRKGIGGILRIAFFAAAWCIKTCGIVLNKIGDEIIKNVDK